VSILKIVEALFELATARVLRTFCDRPRTGLAGFLDSPTGEPEFVPPDVSRCSGAVVPAAISGCLKVSGLAPTVRHRRDEPRAARSVLELGWQPGRFGAPRFASRLNASLTYGRSSVCEGPHDPVFMTHLSMTNDECIAAIQRFG
jgi:hypothetical protein